MSRQPRTFCHRTPATDPQPSEPGILEVSNVGGITVVTEDTKSPVG